MIRRTVTHCETPAGHWTNFAIEGVSSQDCAETTKIWDRFRAASPAAVHPLQIAERKPDKQRAAAAAQKMTSDRRRHKKQSCTPGLVDLRSFPLCFRQATGADCSKCTRQRCPKWLHLGTGRRRSVHSFRQTADKVGAYAQQRCIVFCSPKPERRPRGEGRVDRGAAVPHLS